MGAEESARTVELAVAESLERISKDPIIAPRAAGHVEAISACLRDTLSHALFETTWPGPLALVAMCRMLHIDRTGLDVLAHHVLTALLAQHPGSDVIVRVGATFSAADCHLGQESSHPGTATHLARRADLPQPTSHDHLPMPPTWACSGCGQDWPCAIKQSQLLVEFGGARANLGLYLGSCLAVALCDLPRAPQHRLQERFLGWIPRDRLN